MAHDLIAFGSAADLSAAGPLNQVILAGETFYPGNGVPGTGTQIYPKVPSMLFGIFTGDETAAQVVGRVRKTTDPDWLRFVNTRLQTTPFDKAINYCMYPISKGDAIESQCTNGAAVFSGTALLIAKKPGDEMYSLEPPVGYLKPGDRLVAATSTFTHVPDSWAQGTLTFVNFTVSREKKYKIVGMAAHSATGWACRLRYTEGPNVNDAPGVPVGDSGGTVPQHVMIYADFGTFDGMNPPLVDTSTVSGADTVTTLHFIIREV